MYSILATKKLLERLPEPIASSAPETTTKLGNDDGTANQWCLLEYDHDEELTLCRARRFKSLSIRTCGSSGEGLVAGESMVAYIAPHMESFAIASSDSTTVRFSGYVANDRGVLVEVSPEFPSLDEAILWARARSVVVWARDVDGDYLWAGAGDFPPGAHVREHSAIAASGRQSSPDVEVDGAIRAEANQFALMRVGRGISINQLSRLSGVPLEVIRRIESSEPTYEADFDTWVRLAIALTGRVRIKAPTSVGWSAHEGGMLESAIALLEEKDRR